MEIESKVTYTRHRVTEAYFWSLGIYFEPQYSQARVIIATAIILFTLLDDMYDAYGTMEELLLFTDAMEKYHIICIYKKYYVLYILNILMVMAYKIDGSNAGGFPLPLMGYLTA